jgi:hypothetical protein
MAIASQNIMATLRGMPDAQLAKYAAMHKNDPFIFPLAFQESQTRKQTRASQQAQMAGQEQPKVVDQAVAEMMPQALPEDTGIAQLPAQNMQGMAGGGIVAFEVGGEVPRFNGQTGSLYRDIYSMTPDEIKEQAARKLRMDAARAGLSGATEAAVAAESPGFVQSAKNALGRFSPSGLAGWGFGTYHGELNSNEDAELKKRWEKPGFKAADQSVYMDAAVDPRRTDNTTSPNYAGARDSAPDTRTEDQGKTSGKEGKKEAGINKLLPAAPGAGKATPTAAPTTDAAQRGLGSIAEYAKEANDYAGADPTARQLERIEKQEAGAAGEKKDALNMALLKAGLGMMAGTSRHAFENIGKGAMAGAEEYGSAMKDLKKAGLERDKMRDAAEQAAYAYKRDDVKGYRAAQEKVADRKTEMEKAQLAASTQLQAAGITAGAHLKAAGMPGAQERLFASLGGGDVAKGLEKYQAAQTDKTGLGFAKLYIDHVTDSRKAGADPMSEQDFLATMTRLSSQMNPKVVTDPKGEVLAR